MNIRSGLICVPSREKERKLRELLILYLYLAELSVFLQKLEGVYSEDAAICLDNRVLHLAVVREIDVNSVGIIVVVVVVVVYRIPLQVDQLQAV
jgi:hypothetical protein